MCVCVCVCVCVIFKNNESYIHPISPLKTRSRTQTLKIPTPKPKNFFFNSWPFSFCSSSFSVLLLPLVADESAFDRQIVLSLIGKRLCFFLLFISCVCVVYVVYVVVVVVVIIIVFSRSLFPPFSL